MHRVLALGLTTIAAACGGDFADFCDTDRPGVQILVEGYPASTQSVEIVVREVPDGQPPCAQALWATTPSGLAEDRDAGAPGDVLSSTVNLERYPRLDLFAYAYDGAVHQSEPTSGTCLRVDVEPEQELICLALPVSPRPVE